MVVDKKTKKKVPQPRAHGVHSTYESTMVDRHQAAVNQGLREARPRGAWKGVTGGRAAAIAVVALMRDTFATITPDEIIREYMAHADVGPTERADALWTKFGARTVSIMADGAACLAMLWESAWKEGDGDHTIKKLDAILEKTLSKLYNDKDFLPSMTIDTIGRLLAGGAASGSAKTRVTRKTAPLAARVGRAPAKKKAPRGKARGRRR
jgi:hypothetical protein